MKAAAFRNKRLPPKQQRFFGFFQGVRIIQYVCAFLLLLNIVLLYAIFLSPHGGISGYRRHRGQVEVLETKIRTLQEENQSLFRQIQRFKNDPEAQERMVREHLGWVRQNELVIEFIPNDHDRP